MFRDVVRKKQKLGHQECIENENRPEAVADPSVQITGQSPEHHQIHQVIGTDRDI